MYFIFFGIAMAIGGYIVTRIYSTRITANAKRSGRGVMALVLIKYLVYLCALVGCIFISKTHFLYFAGGLLATSVALPIVKFLMER